MAAGPNVTPRRRRACDRSGDDNAREMLRPIAPTISQAGVHGHAHRVPVAPLDARATPIVAGAAAATSDGAANTLIDCCAIATCTSVARFAPTPRRSCGAFPLVGTNGVTLAAPSPAILGASRIHDGALLGAQFTAGCSQHLTSPSPAGALPANLLSHPATAGGWGALHAKVLHSRRSGLSGDSGVRPRAGQHCSALGSPVWGGALSRGRGAQRPPCGARARVRIGGRERRRLRHGRGLRAGLCRRCLGLRTARTARRQTLQSRHPRGPAARGTRILLNHDEPIQRSRDPSLDIGERPALRRQR